jgi:uncharacterized protein (DUF302 family)
MHYLSKSVKMSFEEALAALRQALESHHLEILAEIDLRQALEKHLAVEFRPYLILSACSLPLVHRAIEVGDNIGAILVCNVVVQQHQKGHVEISTVDPASTIGTINDVELMWTAREVRFLVGRAIDDVDTIAKSRHLVRNSKTANPPLARALT